MITKKKDTVRNALERLLSVCDGAVDDDGMGFNGFDSGFARDLNSKRDWTYKQEKAAYKMLRKYRKQLSSFGIDYDNLKFENEKEDKSKKELKKVDYKGDGFVSIKFDYKKEYVESVKNIDGRSYDSSNKQWIVPINSTTIPQIRSFVAMYKFEVTDKAVEEINNRKDKKDKEISLEDNKIVVRFPYDSELVSAVKRIPGRKFDGKKKLWRIPFNVTSAKKVIEFADKFDFEVPEELQEEIDSSNEMVELSESKDADIEVSEFGSDDLQLRPFQRAGVKYASEKKRTFIADEVGLGKTVQSLASVHKLNSYPLLIVCPSSLKLNWKREVEKWIGDKSVKIIDGRNNDNFKEYDVYIINYDIVYHNKEEIKRLGLKSIILDESHYVKNYKAKRTKAIQEIVKEEDIEVRLLLSATPIKNRPKELISQLTILDRLNDLGGFWHFAKRYCNAHKTRWGTDMSGNQNLTELNSRLREVGYVRREKKDILSELPSIVRSEVPIEISNRVEYNNAKNDIIDWIRENKSQEDALKASDAEILVRLNTLKKLASEGKRKEVINWVKDFLESDEKLVLFAHHVDLVKSLKEEFDALAIYGETGLEEKQNAVDKFQNDEDEKLIIISLQAGSEGITLTSASNVAFAELGWTSTEHDQAEGRCYGRLNDAHGINSWYLIGENTIDEDILELINEKRDIIDKAIRGKGGDNRLDIAEEIVKRLIN